MNSADPMTLNIFPNDQTTLGPCEHCGEMTTRVWGYVNRGEIGVAAYFVEWTPGHDEQPANFDLIIGRWGDDTDASDRQAVALEYRVHETGPSFRVIDASTRKVGSSSLVSAALDRNSVIGTRLAAEVFAICDVIYLEDPRIVELKGLWA